MLPLTPVSIDYIKQATDLLTLTLLKSADRHARLANEYQLKVKHLEHAYKELKLSLPLSSSIQKADKYESPAKQVTPLSHPLKMLKAIIDQKVAFYEVYNKISNELFIRNLQVYYVRNRWPSDPEQGRTFKNLFAQCLIDFAQDLYQGAEQVAQKNAHSFIDMGDVQEYTKKFIPHIINEHEDAIFFPNLNPGDQVIIESYDMDALRDSGIHWRYLQYAVESPDFKAHLELDPFAAELLVEQIAQFGVLVLRVTSNIGKEKGAKRIHPDHMDLALRHIQKKINQHHQQPAKQPKKSLLCSSSTQLTVKKGDTLFTDITTHVQLHFMHRSSDWLNRLLRTYLKKDAHTGVITIPPAFGGAGIAAEDIDNDGLTDILLLGGVGNKLFKNTRNGNFIDIPGSVS